MRVMILERKGSASTNERLIKRKRTLIWFSNNGKKTIKLNPTPPWLFLEPVALRGRSI